jgi:hypothetical protein
MKWVLIVLLLGSAGLAVWFFRSFVRNSDFPAALRMGQLAFTGFWFLVCAGGAIWLAFA